MTYTRTKSITCVALMTGVMCILSQIQLPLPGGVPVTLQTFAVILAGIVLGPYMGALSMVIYLLLGAAGLPVFAGFKGGLALLAGPTGGFIITFPLLSLAAGFGTKLREKSIILFAIILASGMAVNYLIGTAVFSASTGTPFTRGLMLCVVPFIITDVVKAAAASIVGFEVKNRLKL